MKKISICIMIILSSLLIACGPQTQTVETSNTVNSEVESSKDTEPSDSEAGLTSADVEVDKGLFNVEITIPKDYVGETTQDKLDKEKEENGYKSATLNADGSVTFVMTRQQHGKLMDEMKKTINEALDEMVTGKDYPNITAIEPNDDYTKFKVTTQKGEATLEDSVATVGLYMYGGMYNLYNGTKADNIEIEWINESSGKVYSTSNSKDLGN